MALPLPPMPQRPDMMQMMMGGPQPRPQGNLPPQMGPEGGDDPLEAVRQDLFATLMTLPWFAAAVNQVRANRAMQRQPSGPPQGGPPSPQGGGSPTPFTEFMQRQRGR